MWVYLVTFIAVALIPLLLAAVGGHLATLALQEGSQRRRNFVVAVWFLAALGIALFAALEVSAYNSDKARTRNDETFRTGVNTQLQKIRDESDPAKRYQAAANLQSQLQPPSPSGAKPARPKPTKPAYPTESDPAPPTLDPFPPPVAAVSQHPLDAEERGKDSPAHLGEGDSRFYPGVRLNINVSRTYDDPSFDIVCAEPCTVGTPWLSRVINGSIESVPTGVASHTSSDSIYHRIEIESKLVPRVTLSLTVRSYSDTPPVVLSVVSTPTVARQ